MGPDLFYIVDGHSQIHRCYHAPFGELSVRCIRCRGTGEDDGIKGGCDPCNGTGREPTKAVYLFSQMIVKLIRERKPAYLAVAMDGPRHKLRRRKLHPGYKGDRKDTPQDLLVQFKRCRQVLDALGVATFQVDGYEADDVIATLTTKCVSDDVEVRIVTRDKDMTPLLADPRVKFYDPQAREEMDAAWVRRKWGVEAKQMGDYLALVGDPGDCVPGVTGIGKERAVKLLARYGSLLGMHLQTASANGITDPDLIRVLNARQELRLSESLVKLDVAVPIKLKPSALLCDELNIKVAGALFRRLGFKRLSESAK